MRMVAAVGRIGRGEWSLTLSLSIEEARAICEAWGVIPSIEGTVLRITRSAEWEELHIEDRNGRPVLGRLRSLKAGQRRS